MLHLYVIEELYNTYIYIIIIKKNVMVVFRTKDTEHKIASFRYQMQISAVM